MNGIFSALSLNTIKVHIAIKPFNTWESDLQILVCLTPDDFTCQSGSHFRDESVNNIIEPLKDYVPFNQFSPESDTFYYFPLSNTQQFYLSMWWLEV